jgi:hypothetical protein
MKIIDSSSCGLWEIGFAKEQPVKIRALLIEIAEGGEPRSKPFVPFDKRRWGMPAQELSERLTEPV